MKRFLAVLILFASTAQADFKLLELNQVYVDAMSYHYSSDPWLAPYYKVANRLDLHTNMDFINEIMFIDTMVHSETDKDQFRLVGLNYRIGVHVTHQIDFYMEHFSLHLLDFVPNMSNSYDALGIRINLFKK